MWMWCGSLVVFKASCRIFVTAAFLFIPLIENDGRGLCVYYDKTIDLQYALFDADKDHIGLFESTVSSSTLNRGVWRFVLCLQLAGSRYSSTGPVEQDDPEGFLPEATRSAFDFRTVGKIGRGCCALFTVHILIHECEAVWLFRAPSADASRVGIVLNSSKARMAIVSRA
ncbi:hypothetical protein R6Q59_010126 [Mikania micrantha]